MKPLDILLFHIKAEYQLVNGDIGRIGRLELLTGGIPNEDGTPAVEIALFHPLTNKYSSNKWKNPTETRIDLIKPILWPLSHIKQSMPEHDHYDFYFLVTKLAMNYHGYKHDHVINRLDNFIRNKDYRVLPHWVVERAIEWDFDLLGLIKTDQAVDKTTIYLNNSSNEE